eukprot:g5205.t1
MSRATHLSHSSAASAIAASQNSAGAKRKRLSFVPAPLILDAQGREIDASGKLIVKKDSTTQRKSNFTIKANRRKEREKSNPYLQHRRAGSEANGVERKIDTDIEGADGTVVSEMYDPRIRVKNAERKKKALKFVQEGKYVDMGNRMRTRIARNAILRAAQEEGAAEHAKKAARSKTRLSFAKMGATFADRFVPRNVAVDGSENGNGETKSLTTEKVGHVALPARKEEKIPTMEWWDIAFLPKSQRTPGNDGDRRGYENLSLENSRTAGLVEHPVKIEPIIPEEAQEALPLMLTKKERKRKRRIERLAKEKEKREKIRLGLMDAPEPKVKISNLMRVLGDDAVANPSLAETYVRNQVGARRKIHEMTNLARKSTPEERKARKLEKLKKDQANGLHVAIFRVGSLVDKKKRFKIDVNAQQLLLTGRALHVVRGDCSVVVAEGGAKALRKFRKLMTQRIRWTKLSPSVNEDGVVIDGAPEEDIVEGRPNFCRPVWEGPIAKRSFKDFRFEEAPNPAKARRVLEIFGAPQYWDMAHQCPR